MTDRRPIWLLDVDGVLNACRADLDGGYMRRLVPGNGTVTYRPAVVRRITRLHAAGGVDIRWLSTWMERADRLAAVTGLPPGLPVEGRGHWMKGGEYWWKATAARQVSEANPDRFVIWTDDDLADSYGRGELDWVVGRAMLRISPAPEVGLTDAEMSMVEAALGGKP